MSEHLTLNAPNENTTAGGATPTGATPTGASSETNKSSPNAAGAARARLETFVEGFTVETTPGASAKIGDYRDHLPRGAHVSVTLLQGAEPADTVATARRLRAEGFEPAPHFSARLFASRTALEEYLKALRGEADVRHVVAIAGGVGAAAGPFDNSMDLLATGLFDKHGVESIGVAGHPEGSPDIPPAELEKALAWKNKFAGETDAALYMVTQFCFEAAPVIDWERRIREMGNRLPIHIGVAGLASPGTLLKYAKLCGVGPSMRFLTRQSGRNIAKLMRVATPGKMLIDLSAHTAKDPDCLILRPHVYPFGGLARTAAWFNALADGAFDFTPDGDDLIVHT